MFVKTSRRWLLLCSLQVSQSVRYSIFFVAQVLFDTCLDDLSTFSNELCDLFVKCMTSLSVQCSIVSTVLALLFRGGSEFPQLVVDQLISTLETAYSQGDAYTAKLALRSLC